MNKRVFIKVVRRVLRKEKAAIEELRPEPLRTRLEQRACDRLLAMLSGIADRIVEMKREEERYENMLESRQRR